MAHLEFQDLFFEKEEGRVKVTFMNNYYFYLEIEELEKISKFTIKNHSIDFTELPEKSARRKFDFLLSKGFDGLRNKLTNRRTIYIHKNSEIPLIGSIYFGIVDRGSNIIELRPSTGCNLNCIYCSVDEGKDSKKQVDYIVELDYLVNEFRKLAEFKDCDIEAHINPQGEPILYPRIVELVRELSSIKQVKVISMDTNGTLLTKELVDKLADAGLTRFNLSLNAIEQETGQKLAGMPYNIEKVKEIARYIATKTDIIIAPIWVPGINDYEMPKLVQFAIDIGAGKNCPAIGIQNYLSYKFGRNPAKQVHFDVFYKKLEEWGKQTGINLINSTSDFKIISCKSYPISFRKGEIVKARVVCHGRLKNEMLAVSKDRVIAVPNCSREGIIKMKITRTKHNIFIGALI